MADDEKAIQNTEGERRDSEEVHGSIGLATCSAVGQFASELSPEWVEFANDLIFEDFAKDLQEAGYDVLEFSQECDHGFHRQYAEKNGLRIPSSLHCWCECHGS